MPSAASRALVPATGPQPPDDPAPPGSSDLAHQLRRGSRAAMTAVFTEHLDVIYNYCYRRTGSWSAAEDLSSTVFLEVWRNRSRIVDLDGSVLPWIYGVATNVCRNHLRSTRRHTGATSRWELLDQPTNGHGDELADRVADRVDTDRRVRAVLERLAELPAADQDVFILAYWEGLSYAEAAAALAIPIGTVRSRLARVRRTLRLTEPTAAPSETHHE